MRRSREAYRCRVNWPYINNDRVNNDNNNDNNDTIIDNSCSSSLTNNIMISTMLIIVIMVVSVTMNELYIGLGVSGAGVPARGLGGWRSELESQQRVRIPFGEHPLKLERRRED